MLTSWVSVVKQYAVTMVATPGSLWGNNILLPWLPPCRPPKNTFTGVRKVVIVTLFTQCGNEVWLPTATTWHNYPLIWLFAILWVFSLKTGHTITFSLRFSGCHLFVLNLLSSHLPPLSFHFLVVTMSNFKSLWRTQEGVIWPYLQCRFTHVCITFKHCRLLRRPAEFDPR